MDIGNYKGSKALYSLCETVVYKGPKALLSLYETMTIYKGPKALYSLCETMVYEGLKALWNPFGATVIQTGSISSTQTGPRYQNFYAADLFFPNRHTHLSLYQVLSRQSICIFMFCIYLIFPNNYCHSEIIYDIYTQSFIHIFAFFINIYAYHVCL